MQGMAIELNDKQLRTLAHLHGVPVRVPGLENDGFPLGPATLAERLGKHSKAAPRFRIARGEGHEHADLA